MDRSHLCLAALGHPQRLALWQHLRATGAGPVAAGTLAATLGMKPSTLSVYLRKLADAGLVTQEVAGNSRRYHVPQQAVDAVLRELGYLPSAFRRELPLRVGFVCRNGGARSRFAAALLNRVGQPRFLAAPGGQSAPRRDPLADHFLAAHGHDAGRLQAAVAPHVVIRLTRTPQPLWTDYPIAVHWAVPDPGPDGPGVLDSLSRLERLYRNLSFLVAHLANMPVEGMTDTQLRAALEGTPRAARHPAAPDRHLALGGGARALTGA